MTLEFGREICSDFNIASKREWLVTNGIGGYASGTIAGALTRRYHGLLIAPLSPPLERTLLVSKFDETVSYGGHSFPLFVNHWQDRKVEPAGFEYLESFHLEGTTPVWAYTVADGLLEKRVWMQQGENTTYIRYDFVRGSHPLTLAIKVLVNHRNHHESTKSGDFKLQAELQEQGLQMVAFEGAAPFYLLSTGAEATPKNEWYKNYFLSMEAYRGLDAIEDHLHAGDFYATLAPGESLTVVASTEGTPNLDGEAAYNKQRAYERILIDQSLLSNDRPEVQQLVLAADQFVIQRPTTADPEGHSIIAGYPWFGDWGRDTMISLPGLTLTTGRPKIACNILRTYSHYVDQGMLPNRFPEVGDDPEYNTVDATLWYFEAVRAYLETTNDDDLLKELFPILDDIIAWHTRGTRYNIHMDPDDSLLYAGAPSVQLTWMDAKVDDWVVTPRIGKPVEINALWFNALRVMAVFAERVGVSGSEYSKIANRVSQNFSRFWNSEKNYCFDVIDGPQGDDPSLRPNQLFAVSLPNSPLSQEQQRGVVNSCAQHLLTPHGLRSLSPDEKEYIGLYGGDLLQRDSAYHQGVTWGWLIGPYIQAHLRVYNDPELARTFLNPLLLQLTSHGVGSISEIFDGNPPFAPRGCIAQAWSVAEALRLWQLTKSLSDDQSIDF